MSEKIEQVEQIEKLEKLEKIEQVEQIKKIIKITYEWQTTEPTPEHNITLFPATKVEELLRRLGIYKNMSGLAFFHGDVELDGVKTFAECNLTEGVILTVRQAPAPGVTSWRKEEERGFRVARAGGHAEDASAFA
jgi:hypothetical protein